MMNTIEKPLLEVRNLSVRFFKNETNTLSPILNDISFHVNENEVFGIIGESGSGKSITLLSILGLLQVSPGIIKGDIIFNNNGESVNTLENIEQHLTINNFEKYNENISTNKAWKNIQRSRYKKILGKQVSMVFQNPRLAFNPYYSIGKQITESILLHKPNTNKEIAKTQAIDWLRRVKMEAPEVRYNNNPYGLSGGMCQRAMIAMALASSPQLLIADEPTTGLDATIQGDILSLLETLKNEEKLSMIIVSHDLNVMHRLTNRIAVYYRGFIIEEGSTEKILNINTNHHPYTTLLLTTEYEQQLSSIDKDSAQPSYEEGNTNKDSFFSSCPYSNNCQLKNSEIKHKCENALPPLMGIKENHRIRCWKFGD